MMYVFNISFEIKSLPKNNHDTFPEPRGQTNGGGPGFGLANRLRYDLSVPPPPGSGLLTGGGLLNSASGLLNSASGLLNVGSLLSGGLPAPVCAYNAAGRQEGAGEYNFLLVSN